jgi:enoyl-CoA hydratase/carnithine racemase
MSSEEQPVVVERRGRVGILKIDRPDRLNALSRPTLYALGRLGRELVADRDVRAIVVTGAGDKAFCAGADLKERRGMSNEDIRVQVGLYRSELGVLDESPKPVVAAINGAALGGGLELAMVCDLRVAVPSAVLGLPETSLGIIPGAGGTQRLARLIGEGRATELICLARRLSAAEALAWGLVNRVVSDGADLLDDVVAWLEPIAQGAPIAQAAALKAIRVAHEVPLARGLELESVYYDETLRSKDRLEALTAFAEKRKPVFSGE